jgi:predicted nuclease of predicted toxin-antitoxin system
MALRLYMDVHVPAAITSALKRRGISVITSQEDGTREADDNSLLHRATELMAVLVTQDADFLGIAAVNQSHTGIVFAQHGTGIGELIEDLQLIAELSEAVDLRGQIVFAPLR